MALGLDGAFTELTVRIKHVKYSEAARWPMTVSQFIRTHRKLLLPAKEERLVIALKSDYKLYAVEKGEVTFEVPIALGQDGQRRKSAEGDNRTPEGAYRITQKALGPFDGNYGAYLGAAWLRLSYPNQYDAQFALLRGSITKSQSASIQSADASGSLAPTGTALGDGIGIHGWVKDWPDGQHDLTWGCISLREADLLKLHAFVKKGTQVLILSGR